MSVWRIAKWNIKGNKKQSILRISPIQWNLDTEGVDVTTATATAEGEHGKWGTRIIFITIVIKMELNCVTKWKSNKSEQN